MTGDVREVDLALPLKTKDWRVPTFPIWRGVSVIAGEWTASLEHLRTVGAFGSTNSSVLKPDGNPPARIFPNRFGVVTGLPRVGNIDERRPTTVVHGDGEMLDCFLFIMEFLLRRVVTEILRIVLWW